MRVPIRVAALLVVAPYLLAGRESVAAPDAKVSSRAPPPLISRRALLAETDKDDPKLSPNGLFASFTAPSNGTVNVWISSTTSPIAPTAITSIHDGTLAGYDWSADSTKILYLVDATSGSHRLETFDLRTTQSKVVLTTATKISLYGTSRTAPGMVVIGVARGDAKPSDLYEVDTASGKKTLVLENSSFSSVLLADDLKPVVGLNKNAVGDTSVVSLNKKGDPHPILSFPSDDYQPASVLNASMDGGTLYLLDARGRDKAALLAFDIASGSTQVLCADDKTDIRRVFFDRLTRKPLMCLAEYGTFSWTALDDAVRGDIEFLNQHLRGYWSPNDATNDGVLWLIYSDGTPGPSSYELYDRKRHALTTFFLTTPELAGSVRVPTHAIEIKARDGLPLVAYLTLPGSGRPDADDRIRPDKPLPMVLLVHGGPWGRAYQRLYPQPQWLANRGFAVLDVQFRGSTGFGRRFMQASYKQWGGTMQTDLMDSVAWAIQNGITRPGKVALWGRSYGGYAALLGLLEAPGTFACGVDISGPSDLAAFIGSADEATRSSWYQRIGDPRIPSELARLNARSPAFEIAKLKRPLLIIQGGEDPIVHKADTDRMVAAMGGIGKALTYVVYPKAGHFFTPSDDESVLALSETFLVQCLGGRAEPLGDLSQAHLQVVQGRDFISGLNTAPPSPR